MNLLLESMLMSAFPHFKGGDLRGGWVSAVYLGVPIPRHPISPIRVSSEAVLKEERQCMRSLFLLFLDLSLFPQLSDEQTHLFRPGIRIRVFAAEVEIIPQPLPVIGLARDRNFPFLKNGIILFPNIGWNHLHSS